jgi:hypothetical protein
MLCEGAHDGGGKARLAISVLPIANATTDVIGAVVGILGVIIGILGFLAARRQRGEVERLRERTQAEKISAWADKRTDAGRVLRARNASDQVVNKVRVWLVTPATPAPERGLPDREPSTRRSVLEPGDTLEHLIPESAMRGAAPADRPPVILAFVDVDGRQWVRSANGALSRG